MSPSKICLTAIYALGGIVALQQGVSAAPQPTHRPPNIVFVLADDLGLSRVGCYGADEFQTPHIDKLAATGVRFERAYSMPLCGPTRAAMLTGKYPFRTGAIGNGPETVFDTDRHVPFPRLLQRAGYATCCIGKLGQIGNPDDRERPAQLGFDEYMLWMGRGSADRYWNPKYYKNGIVVRGKAADYGPDLTHEYLVDFMGRHTDKPFFVFYSGVLTHSPYGRTPDSEDDSQHVTDMVEYFDKQMGRLAEALGKLGLRDNTILIITSDNGPAGDPLGTVNGRPMIGKKSSACEGGVREPFIVNCPALVPSGRVCSDLTDITDVGPTVMELAGAGWPAEIQIDGRSIAPQMLGRKGTPREWVYAQVEQDFFLATHRHKLYGDGRFLDITESPVAENFSDDDAAREKLAVVLRTLRSTAATDASQEPTP